MDPKLRTPIEIFTLPQRLVIPLFQRPYVWTEETQWQPLWEDIRRVADASTRDDARKTTHFLGAIVIQDSDKSYGDVAEWAVIDGQQRLTTLQLFFDAAAAVFETRGYVNPAARLGKLTHNDAVFQDDLDEADDDSPLKLVHLNRDRDPFQAVMLAAAPIDYSALQRSKIVDAHRFFTERIAAWLDEVAGEDETLKRVRALADTATKALQLVVISLKADENSQEIFETLNARGTPLTAADLIKNFVLQELRREGGDVDRAYLDLWPFDEQFWEQDVSAGRYRITRSSLFLSQWLISRVGEELSPTATFSRFKHFVLYDSGESMRALLKDIRAQADRYRGWVERASDPKGDVDRIDLHVYRTEAMQLELTKPLLLLMTEPGREVPAAAATEVVGMLESWLVRRALLRLTTSDLGRAIADLVARLREGRPDEAVYITEDFLRGLRSRSNYWPGNAELAAALAIAPAYRQQPRGRLRMVLESIEDWYRGFSGSASSKSGDRVPRSRKLQVEHLLPRAWETNWPVADDAAVAARAERVHRLGNLTLLTGTLNGSVSNAAWLGPKGKREEFKEYDLFLMNRHVHSVSADGWDEVRIDERTAELTRAIIDIWPVPEEHDGVIVDRADVTLRSVAFADLIAAGLLEAGTELQPRPGKYGDLRITVLASGEVTSGDEVFPSPSAAAWRLSGSGRNAWFFWRLPDGRELDALRAQLVAKG